MDYFKSQLDPFKMSLTNAVMYFTIVVVVDVDVVVAGDRDSLRS